MRFFPDIFRFSLLILAVLCLIPCTSAWTFSGWTGPADKASLQTGTPVKAGYTLSFSSYETGKTFSSDNSLVMYTDLAEPRWVVTKTEMIDEYSPLTTDLVSRSNMQIRLDGYDLSYSRTEFTVDVRLTGKVPALNQSKEIIVLRLQERGADGETVKGTEIKKVAEAQVPTTVPTPPPTTEPVVQAQDTVLVITPEPTTIVTTSVPVKKQTYSPGPDPLLACSVLFGLVILFGLSRHRQ